MDLPLPYLSASSSPDEQNATLRELLRGSRQKMLTEGSLETARLGRILGHTSVADKVSDWIRHTSRRSHYVDYYDGDSSDEDSLDDDYSDYDFSARSTANTPFTRRRSFPPSTLGPNQARPFRQSQETLNVNRVQTSDGASQDESTFRNEYDDEQEGEFDAQRSPLIDGNSNESDGDDAGYCSSTIDGNSDESDEEDAGYSSSNIDDKVTDTEIEDALTVQPLNGTTDYISDDIWAVCPPKLAHTGQSPSDCDTSGSYVLREPQPTILSA